MLSLIQICILLVVPCLCELSSVNPTVETRQGLIRGLLSDNGQYFMFLGLPYAKVDEKNPFGPSLPHAAFNGTFEAFDDSAECPQISVHTNKAIGTIDCLRLNVYVPRTTSSLYRLPVMVWFHSGALLSLSGNRVKYTPDFLVRHNVIIVSINYRLGVYGFLCLNTPTVSGNQGLKDQFLALKWVRENIQSFGGDANKVTIFGESSGALSIRLHLLSNYEMLYDKAIVQSGPAMTPFRLVKPNNMAPLRIAEKLNFTTRNVEDALTFLAKQNAHLVTEVSKELGISSFNGTIFPETRPCIENKFEGAFITDYPFNIKPTKVRNMSIMLGHTNQEMIYKFDKIRPEVFETYSFKDRLTSGLDLIDDEMVDLVKEFYIGDRKVDISLKNEIINFESDFNFNHPTKRTIKRYMDEGARLYYYIFSYEGGRNYMKIMRNITSTGAAHADDLGYIFISDLLHDTPTPEDQQVIDMITIMWTNFAKYGDPTPYITELLPVKWVPVSEAKQYYLDIDSGISLHTRPFQERMAFWDLFYKLNGESQNVFRLGIYVKIDCDPPWDTAFAGWPSVNDYVRYRYDTPERRDYNATRGATIDLRYGAIDFIGGVTNDLERYWLELSAVHYLPRCETTSVGVRHIKGKMSLICTHSYVEVIVRRSSARINSHSAFRVFIGFPD